MAVWKIFFFSFLASFWLNWDILTWLFHARCDKGGGNRGPQVSRLCLVLLKKRSFILWQCQNILESLHQWKHVWAKLTMDGLVLASICYLTLKLLEGGGGGLMALPLNLNTKNLQNADCSWYFQFMYILFDKVRVYGNWKHLPKIIQFWKKRETMFEFELWSIPQ